MKRSVEDFFAMLGPNPRVLELGTLRWGADPSHHRDRAPEGSTYVMTDVEAGRDVDVVADAHDLATFPDQSFDAVIAVSVWEHLARPWIAAQAVARVMKPGAVLYIDTHQSFPIHGYPHDYFRFSDIALALLFEDAGLETVGTEYKFPAKIVPPKEVTRWNPAAPVFLNVGGIWRKPF